MSLRHTILGFLSWKPLTGYDLKKVMGEADFLPWSCSNNQIYTTLIDLHREGLVSVAVESQERLPARKVYTATESGREVLKAWLVSEPQAPELRSAFLLRLAWADLLSAEEMEGLLEGYLREVSAQIALLGEKIRRGPLNPARTPRERALWDAIHRHCLEIFETELRGIRTLRADLARLERETSGRIVP